MTELDEQKIDNALAGIGQLAGFAKAVRSAQDVFEGLTLARQAQAEVLADVAKAKAELLQTTDEITRRRAAQRKLPDSEEALAERLSDLAAVEGRIAALGAEADRIAAENEAASVTLADKQARIRDLAAKLGALAGED